MTERIAPAPFAFSADGPALEPFPGGAQVLVNVVINLEHWTLDRPMPRAALPAPGGLTVVPDVANHSWVLYGLRAGLPRLAAALAPLGRHVTVALNADVIDHYPAIADLIEERGWEVVAHGVRQQSIQSYPAGAEPDVIAETIARITERFGAPRGWLSPGMNQSDDSLRLMREAGLEFNHDWMIDDRPVWLTTSAGPILGVPYTLTLNDVTTYQVGLCADGTLADRTIRTLDRHVAEATASGGHPAVMPIGLHPHIVGVPHRIAEIEQIVAAVQACDEAAFVTSSQIYDWYAAQVVAP